MVLHLRREIRLDQHPAAMPVTVTADNRFILFVNGKRVASGPSTGTLTRWRTAVWARNKANGCNPLLGTRWNLLVLLGLSNRACSVSSYIS